MTIQSCWRLKSDGMKVLSLFSGIGGLDLAAEWSGMEVVAFCEIEPYAVSILQRRWPNVPIFNDVCTLGRDTLSERGIWPDDIDVIVGGFPCQPFSIAGKRRGKEDERFLWGEFSRLIEEIRPAWVVGENVPGLISIALDDVLADLESKGYGCLPLVYPAAAVGAPHKRERIFIVAHRHKQRLQGCKDSNSNSKNRAKPLDQFPARCNSGQLWRTPDANCDRGPSSNERMKWKLENNMPISLNDQVACVSNTLQKWPTPVASWGDGREGGTGTRDMFLKHYKNKEGVSRMVGQLNPNWVEILMGFPVGWTDVDCEEPTPWPGWPAGLGAEQYEYEPPRTIKGCPNRAKRLKCLGNAVVPQQAYPIFKAIMEVSI